MVQALLARQRLEQEEQTSSTVPSDISSPAALTQAMLARQRAEDQEAGAHRPLSRALAVPAQAWQRAGGQERDEYFSPGFYESPVGASSMVTRRAEDPPSSASSVMMQVMQARQRAEDEERPQRAPAPPQNPAPAGSSALIQAMLARQQAQNEYDDGY